MSKWVRTKSSTPWPNKCQETWTHKNSRQESSRHVNIFMSSSRHLHVIFTSSRHVPLAAQLSYPMAPDCGPFLPPLLRCPKSRASVQLGEKIEKLQVTVVISRHQSSYSCILCYILCYILCCILLHCRTWDLRTRRSRQIALRAHAPDAGTHSMVITSCFFIFQFFFV